MQLGKKIGIWSVISLVIGSQIGAGALSSTSIFAKYGTVSLYACLIASVGAMSLAYIFSKLCFMYPNTGGPHVYIQKAFGSSMSLVFGWVYWIVSWTTTTIILISCVTYLSEIIGIKNQMTLFFLGIVIWVWINYINCVGLDTSAYLEIILTVIKVLFFVVMIIVPLYYFDLSNFKGLTKASSMPDLFNIGNLSLKGVATPILTALWGFVGIEVATTPAESVENPKKTIPRAVIFGTLIVALIYLLSIFAALGAVHHSQLTTTAAPYSLIALKVFGSNFFINISAVLLCLGSLNVWVLSAGQVALGLSKDKLLPKKFGELKNGVPRFSILLSAFGVGIIWCFCIFLDMSTFVSEIIDSLTPGFVLIYLICALAFLKMNNNSWSRVFSFSNLVTIISIFFCGWLLSETTKNSALINLITIFSAIPLLYLQNPKR